ncbi:MAG: CsbD family protein [Trichococcus flocculiformis]
MNSNLGDKAKGMKDKVVGKIKEEYGDLVGDSSKELEGKLQQARGEAIQKKGEIKEDLHDKTDDLADKANDKIDEWKK